MNNSNSINNLFFLLDLGEIEVIFWKSTKWKPANEIESLRARNFSRRTKRGEHPTCKTKWSRKSKILKEIWINRI